jgi:peptide-methionine (S)-S-oxide reductase
VVTIGFGGGCHWCTEAVFQPLEGVSEVRQGFIRSDGPDEAWSEAVEISFDPDRVSFAGDLIAVHLSTHASEADHKMRGKYRSAVYRYDAEQQNACATHIRDLAAEAEVHFVTRSLMHRGFKPSDSRFHDYYKSTRTALCRTYIAPKLAKLRARHSALLKKEYTTS